MSEKLIFVCWKEKGHPGYTEFRWEETHMPSGYVKCPMCGSSSKITQVL